jgi:hypothetical protein
VQGLPSAGISVTVAPSVFPPSLNITTDSSLPNAKVGQSYSVSFYASGLTVPAPQGLSRTFGLVSGSSFPPGIGLSLGSDSTKVGWVGTIGGVPTTAGIYTLNYKLTEGTRSTTKSFTASTSTSTPITATSQSYSQMAMVLESLRLILEDLLKSLK